MAVPQLRQGGIEVPPVLIAWCGARTGVQLPTEPVRVDVVCGVAAAKIWRDVLSKASIVPRRDGIDQVRARMREQAAQTAVQDLSDPSPPTLGAEYYWTAAATAFATALGLLGGHLRLAAAAGRRRRRLRVRGRRRGGRCRVSQVGRAALTRIGLAGRSWLVRRPPGCVEAIDEIAERSESRRSIVQMWQ